MTRQDFLKTFLVFSAIPALANLNEASSEQEALEKLATIIDRSTSVNISNLQFTITPSKQTKLHDVQYIFRYLKPTLKDISTTNSLNKFTNTVEMSEIVLIFANRISMKKTLADMLVYMKSKNVKQYISRLI